MFRRNFTEATLGIGCEVVRLAEDPVECDGSRHPAEKWRRQKFACTRRKRTSFS
ncbi:hypothetical protein [Noviherbaspirillum sp. ST 5-3]|uniref:hypothetical protein n=1 Tax=Noviherbaspirillum sp. ST 5-3 TaxID=3349878 RepID=UPI003916F19B